jgi:DNA-directed RNA polymerase subunit RPC12/RpoP
MPDGQAHSKPGESIDAGKGRIFPCEQCGADLEFSIGQQALKCPYCGHEKLIELATDAEISEQDFHDILVKVREWREKSSGPDQSGQSEVRCVGCGGNVVFVGPLTSSECPYCSSPIQRDKVHDSPKRIPVHGVLPFQIEKEKARRNLTKWVKSRWFAPSEFSLRGVEGRFNGVYLPFWTYDSMTFSRYSGERGEHYYVTVTDNNNQTRQEQRTRWWPVSGSHQRFFDDVLILGAKGLRRASDVRGLIGGDVQRVHEIKTRYDAITFKHLLLPVWLLAYRYHDTTYQVFINAVTGEVQGERPYSFWKIFLTVLMVVGVVAIVVAIRILVLK